MLNKPPRVLAVSSDEPGLDRRTIMDLVDHPAAQRLFPIGRLDYETSGLILLTNDGQLANRLTHPRYGVPRRYQAVVKGSLNDDDLRRVQKDLLRLARRAAGERARQRGRPAPAAVGAGAIELSLAKREPDRTTIDITIHHGRIGEIGELLAAAGIRAKKLQRTGIGPLELKGLARGQWRELERHELQALRSVGKATAASNKPSPEDRKTPARRTQARRGNSS